MDWLKESPAYYAKLLNCKVKILCKNDKCYKGYVYTVDPVSNSVLLYNLEDKILNCVLGHAIISLEVLEINPLELIPDEIGNYFNNENIVSVSELKQRKEKLKLWMIQNRLPVKELEDHNEVLSLAGSLEIWPPYTVDSCKSKNEIILTRVQSIIKELL